MSETSTTIQTLEGETDRSPLERLSGWRLFLFLLIALVNLAVLVAFIVTALILGSSRLRLALLILSALNCMFVFAINSTSLTATTKIVLGAGHVVLCGLAFWNIHKVSSFSLPRAEVCLYLVPAIQTILITTGGFAFQYWRQDKQIRFRFSVGDLMILLLGASLLFPLMLTIFKSGNLGFLSPLDTSEVLAAGRFALLNCAIVTLATSFAVWPTINSQFWAVARLMLFWNLIVVGAARVFYPSGVTLNLIAIMTTWSVVCLMPLFGTAAKSNKAIGAKKTRLEPESIDQPVIVK